MSFDFGYFAGFGSDKKIRIWDNTDEFPIVAIEASAGMEWPESAQLTFVPGALALLSKKELFLWNIGQWNEAPNVVSLSGIQVIQIAGGRILFHISYENYYVGTVDSSGLHDVHLIPDQSSIKYELPMLSQSGQWATLQLDDSTFALIGPIASGEAPLLRHINVPPSRHYQVKSIAQNGSTIFLKRDSTYWIVHTVLDSPFVQSLPHISSVGSAEFALDSRVLIATDDHIPSDSGILLIDVETGSCDTLACAPHYEVIGLPDNNLFAVRSLYGNFDIWDIRTRKKMRRLAPSETTQELWRYFANSDQMIACNVGWDSTRHYGTWDFARATFLANPDFLAFQALPIKHGALGNMGREILAETDHSKHLFQLLDATNLSILADSIQGSSSGDLQDYSFSDQSRLFVFSYSDGSIILRNLDSNRTDTLRLPNSAWKDSTLVRISHNGKSLAAFSRTSGLLNWDLSTLRLDSTSMLSAPDSLLGCSPWEISPGLQYVLFSCGNGKWSIWDTKENHVERMASFLSSPEFFFEPSFTYDDRYIVRAFANDESDLSLLLLFKPTGRLSDLIKLPGRPISVKRGFSSNLLDVRLSTGADCVVSTNTKSIVATLINFQDGEWIIYTPEGHFNASAKVDHHVRVTCNGRSLDWNEYLTQFRNPAAVTRDIERGSGRRKVSLRTIMSSGSHDLKPVDTVSGESPSIIISISALTFDSADPVTYAELIVNGAKPYVISLYDDSGFFVGSRSVPLVRKRSNIDIVAHSKEGLQSDTCHLTVFSESLIRSELSDYEKLEAEYPDQRNWAVLLGVGKYSTPSQWPNLPNVRRDLDSVKHCLINMLGYLPDHVIQRCDSQVTQGYVYGLLDSLFGVLSSKDRLVIYFSGHGELDSTNHTRNSEVPVETYLVPFNGNRNELRQSCIPADYFETWLSKQCPAKQIVYVIDACYSGQVCQETEILAKGGSAIQKLLESRSREIMTAGGVEPVSSSCLGIDGLSPFTYYLIRGLRGAADRSLDSLITFDEIAGFVADAIAEDHMLTQTPSHCRLSRGVGSFIFRLSR